MSDTIQSLRGGEESFLTSAIDKMGDEDGNGAESSGLKEATVVDTNEAEAPEVENTKETEKTDNTENTENTDTAEDTTPASEQEGFKSPFDKEEGEEKTEDKPAGDSDSDSDTDFDKETEAELEAMKTAPHPGEAFKKVRGELKDTKAQITELMDKVKAYESGDMQGSAQYEEMKAKIDRYDELIKENESLSQKIATVDYRETPEYKQQILDPYDGIAGLADTLEKRSGLDDGEILSAITNKNYSDQTEAVEALKDRVDERTFSALIKMADDMTILYQREDKLSHNAEALLNEARSSKEAIEAQAKQKSEETYKRSVNNMFDEYQDKIPLFIADDGTESPLSQTLKDQASGVDFDNMNAEQKAFAAMSAVSLPAMIKKYNEMSKKLTALSASKKMEDEASPSGVERSAPTTSTTGDILRDGETPMDAISRIMGG